MRRAYIVTPAIAVATQQLIRCAHQLLRLGATSVASQLGARNSSEMCTGISWMTALPACASTARKSATWPATTKYTAMRVLGGTSAASPACSHVCKPSATE